LEEKRKIYNAEFIVVIEKRRPDNEKLGALLLSWDYENLVGGIFKLFGSKAIKNI
jgi:hypothetical protein